MRIRFFLQARMGSKRLPGKSLMPMAGKPLVQHIFDTFESLKLKGDLVLLTSKEPQDDPLAEFAKGCGIQVFRGENENVARRFLDCLKQNDCDFFVRLNGDSPLLDGEIIRAILKNIDSKFDLVTTKGAQVPSGTNVEAVSSSIFRATYERFEEPGDFEHVTQYFYRKSSDFKILPVTFKADFSHFKWSVDTAEDFERVGKIVSTIGPDSSFDEKVQAHRELFP